MRRDRRHSLAALAAVAAVAVLASCAVEPSSTPEPSVVPPSTATPTATASPRPSDRATPAPATPPPEPTLSLDAPEERDDRRVEVVVATDVAADGDGRIDITVVSLADTMITELVLRWPEALHDTLFPAPFVPSEDRIRDGGQPLVQEWTKWVVGPGERGEPEGTVSLGYGPLPAGGTLEIPLFVTRRATGEVAFDLHILAGEALLAREDGAPAELRIEVP